jgi:hypothetical protein
MGFEGQSCEDVKGVGRCHPTGDSGLGNVSWGMVGPWIYPESLFVQTSSVKITHFISIACIFGTWSKLEASIVCCIIIIVHC